MQANLKMSTRYFPRRKRTAKIDTAAERALIGRAEDVLQDASRAWESGEEWRRKAARNERYVFGNQWGDRVRNPETGAYTTEEELIRRQGNQPLKNNRLRVIVRSVLGVYSSAKTEPVCIARTRADQGKGEVMSATLQYVYQHNKLSELNRRALEYMMIAGVPVFREDYGWRNDSNDVWVDLVNYNDFFFDPHMKDPRHEDCHLVGQLWDLGLWDVKAMFSLGDRRRAEAIGDLYAGREGGMYADLTNRLTDDVKRNRNFFVPDDPTKCRVIEVWRKEAKERLRVHDLLTGELYKVETDEEGALRAENERRIREQAAAGVLPEDMKLLEWEWFIDMYWYFYYLTPSGHVLLEGETPYWHKSHPFSFKIYPFYNSRVYPFVSDFIDQQRYINRLIMLQDFMVRASAKGVLMFPEELIPDNKTRDDVLGEWVKYNGVIFFKSKPNVPMPQQIVGNTTQLGLSDMLAIQLKLLDDISGVQGALQGRTPSSGTPASLYAQETQNAASTLTDLLESFKSMLEGRDWKIVKLIQQYYTEPRYVNPAGSHEPILYNPSEVRNAEFELSIGESTQTPAFRTVMDNMLMQLFEAGALTVEELLENSSMPFADKLLQSIRSRMDAARQTGQLPDMAAAVPPEAAAAVQQGVQPAVRQAINN